MPKNPQIALALISLGLSATVASAGTARVAQKGWAEPTAVTRLFMLGRSPAFYAEVDGHRALLELDTGSFELRLSPKFVQDNGLNPLSVQLKLGASINEKVEPIIEGLAEPEEPLADKFALHSDGIVGLDFLRKFAIGIDNQNRQVSFWQGGKVGSDQADNWSLLTEEKQRPAMATLSLTTRSAEDWYRIKSTINGESCDLILDTGTAISTVNPSIAARLHLRTVGQTEVEEIGHTETLSIVQADSITFGPYSAVFPVLNVESEESKDSDGILGSEALGQGKYILDLPDLKVYMRRFSKYRDVNPLEVRLRNVGLDFFPDPQRHLVVLVAPGSEAAKAGIRSGDQLAAIGRISVAQLYSLFEGKPDPSVKQDLYATGMELLKKDLTVTVVNDQGKTTVIPLPPVNQNNR